ncbi:MAG: sugar ABC transporter ATP-binding protein, partial [Candidatus Cloacimonetes bacterium]|nr:sugar ABC transporter ATP-binding protein [Candidatus Cloacimonadota bacterium]
MKSLLSIKGITKRYSGVMALNNVDIELAHGEVLAVVGENGAGKSTLIKAICGIIEKDNGTISVDGNEVRISNPLDAQQAGIRSVQQHFSLIPTMSVAENLFFNDFPLNKIGIISKEKMELDARELLESLGFNDLDPSQLVSDISVANAQRVEVAKAIKFTPKILILDEPSSVLPENDVKTLFKLIRKLKEVGVGIIY